MLNLVRAQWYRLVRYRPFWGFLGLYGFITAVGLVSVGQGYYGQEGFWDLPALPGEGSALWLDPQDYLGPLGGALYVPLLTCLLAATFFTDEFHDGCIRSIAVSPRFRAEYVGSAVVLIASVAACFVAMGLVVVLAVMMPFFPLLDVVIDGMGRPLRWAADVVLIATVYGMLTLTVAMATRRTGVTVLFGFLLALGQVEVGLLGLADGVGEGLASFGISVPWTPLPLASGMFMRWTSSLTYLPWAVVFPAGQLGGPLSAGSVPTASDFLLMVPWLVAAVGLCWLVMRRRAL